MKKSTIYTKAGDSGFSSLYTGERFPKSSRIFSALGTVDELNSSIGLLFSSCSDPDLRSMLIFIQSRLIDLGSSLSVINTDENSEKVSQVSFQDSHVIQLEQWIDQLDSDLPQLTQFILPSGGESSSRAHMARSICRRAEREIVATELNNEAGLRFINRLSDLLFVIARTCAKRSGEVEITYKKDRS